ncbi:MAG TPA: trp RNA-binding attenuation protein MtrB [Candidatus Dormibacteraeota bacterium]|jgi:transcription attenuation protein (tryptophan RNA-binding attenuator protein)|nr:trp RNA-binding attenuation protein MtrB [Candidatus Dormibacteraeota bacterium]
MDTPGRALEGTLGRYVVVRALEDGVVIMGLTRGRDTRSHHSERLDAGEVLIAQFTELTAAIKVRGRAEILTEVGRVVSGPGPPAGGGVADPSG